MIDWIKINTDADLPKKPGKSNYEYIECLIFYKGEALYRPWNCEHFCWDREDHDDFFCNPLEPTHYAIITPPDNIDAPQAQS